MKKALHEIQVLVCGGEVELFIVRLLMLTATPEELDKHTIVLAGIVAELMLMEKKYEKV